MPGKFILNWRHSQRLSGCSSHSLPLSFSPTLRLSFSVSVCYTEWVPQDMRDAQLERTFLNWLYMWKGPEAVHEVPPFSISYFRTGTLTLPACPSLSAHLFEEEVRNFLSVYVKYARPPFDIYKWQTFDKQNVLLSALSFECDRSIVKTFNVGAASLQHWGNIWCWWRGEGDGGEGETRSNNLQYDGASYTKRNECAVM